MNNKYKEWLQYPALQNLFKTLDKNNKKSIRKLVGSIVTDCESHYIELFNLKRTKTRILFSLLLRNEYLNRVNKSVKLNNFEKSHLKNYIHAKHKIFLKYNIKYRLKDEIICI